jgi:hypothetical protein
MNHFSAPEIKRHCHRCNQITGTIFKIMPAGIGNACEQCGCFRKSRPYISRSQFYQLMPEAAEGRNHEQAKLV